MPGEENGRPPAAGEAQPDAASADDSGKLTDNQWDTLVRNINKKRCTPFLGEEACFGTIPSASEIAHKWASEYHYPLEDTDNLARVAQFIATKYEPNLPRDLITEVFEKITPPDFTQPEEPHAALADLQLPVYISTHCYDFMSNALKAPPRHKDPQVEWCRWHEALQEEDTIFDDEITFNIANPVVYYMFGHINEPLSLVLTEDDYLDFLLNTASNPDLIPKQIRKVFTSTSLLFVGYRFSDLSFRVLLRSLASHLKSGNSKHVSVQVIAIAREDAEQVKQAQEYLSEYSDKLNMGVYWGTSRQFVSALRRRWQQSQPGNPQP